MSKRQVTNGVVRYGSHELQEVKFFRYDAACKDTIVFIHGGAWRDPKNTYDDFTKIIEQIDAGEGQLNLVGVNYRLSPEFKHPCHVVDVVLALHKLYADYGIRRVSIVGHSAGATLLLQLLNFDSIVELAYEHAGPLVELSQDEWRVISRSITNISFDHLFFVDGIYDIVALIDEYPSYKSFVDDAFESPAQYTDATQLSSARFKAEDPFLFVDKNTSFHVVHSLQDELLSQEQSEHFVAFLREHGVDPSCHIGAYGLHEDVYRSRQLGELVLAFVSAS